MLINIFLKNYFWLMQEINKSNHSKKGKKLMKNASPAYWKYRHVSASKFPINNDETSFHDSKFQN